MPETTFHKNIPPCILLIHALFFSSLLFVCLLFAAGCGIQNHRHSDSGRSDGNPAPAWPPPPQSPRILFLRSIANTSEFTTEKSWIKKAVGILFGEEDQPSGFLRPHGVFFKQQKLYVTDPGLHVLHIMDLEKKTYSSVQQALEEDLVSPIGIAVDSEGIIYTTDPVLKKVFVFDHKGKYLKEIGSSGLFTRPAGIAVDSQNVYIVDTHAHHVLVFNKEGRHLYTFGEHGSRKAQFHFPTNIWVNNNRLYVTDSLNFRIQVFDIEGSFISAFGKHGDGSGDFASPKGIAVDSDGHIYVADAQFDIVQIFDEEGRLLLPFGEPGLRDGQLLLPAGLAIDEKDRIYVADSYNKRIQVFQYLKKKEE